LKIEINLNKKIRLENEIDKPLEKKTPWSIVNIIFSYITEK
jgi:hypothetical protein